MVYILDKVSDNLVSCEILVMSKKLTPLKKEGWNFNWRELTSMTGSQTYILRTFNSPNQIEGALCLRLEHDMLIMEALELAPHNIGSHTKRYDHVAGSLIAFGCKQSFKLGGAYRGFLTFVSKSNLVNWYIDKYGAQLALGQRMFIDWDSGERLIKKYLNRKKTDKW